MKYKGTVEHFLAIENKKFKRERNKNKMDRVKLETYNLMMI